MYSFGLNLNTKEGNFIEINLNKIYGIVYT